MKRKSPTREILAIAGVIAGIAVLTSVLEFPEMLGSEFRRYERWNLDEAALVVGMIVIALALFSWRRWRESGREIAERKGVEKELKKSEARNRAVVETATDAIITMTSDGRIRSFNPAAERIFGYEAREVLDRPLKMLIPERFQGPHEAGFRRYLDTGEANVVGQGTVELSGLRKNGTVFPLELSLGEMSEERTIFFTGVIRDVTAAVYAQVQGPEGPGSKLRLVGSGCSRMRWLKGVVWITTQ